MPVNAASKSIQRSDDLARTHDVQFVVQSRLVGTDLGRLHQKLGLHLHFLREQRERGLLTFAGPFFTEQGCNTGNGFYVLKVDSAEDGGRLASEDPLHEAGVCAFTVEPWLQALA